MKTKKFSFSTLITLIILAVALAISVTMMIAMRYFNQQVNAVTQKKALYAHITDIDTKVRTYYESIDEEQLRSALAAGYVNGIQDPYARYLSTDAYKRALLLRQGQAGGVGIRLQTTVNGQLVVGTVDTDSAAQKAGVMAGDVVVSVSGTAVTADDRQKVQTVFDTAAEKLSISVQRSGKTMAFELTAYTYQIKSVSEKMLSDSVGYIRITAIYDNTLAQFKAACSSLENQGAASFIFDLRGCAEGGSLSTMEGMISYLMPHGAYATWTGADGETTNLVADSSHTMSAATVTLVNDGTKGEAELFAGILQEFSATTVIGEKTAGKGKVQDFVPLKADNSALLLTIGEVTLMRGGSIEGVGIQPDTVVTMSADRKAQIGLLETAKDDQLLAAMAVFNSNVTATTTTAAKATTTTTTAAAATTAAPAVTTKK